MNTQVILLIFNTWNCVHLIILTHTNTWNQLNSKWQQKKTVSIIYCWPHCKCFSKEIKDKLILNTKYCTTQNDISSSRYFMNVTCRQFKQIQHHAKQHFLKVNSGYILILEPLKIYIRFKQTFLHVKYEGQPLFFKFPAREVKSCGAELESELEGANRCRDVEHFNQLIWMQCSQPLKSLVNYNICKTIINTRFVLESRKLYWKFYYYLCNFSSVNFMFTPIRTPRKK